MLGRVNSSHQARWQLDGPIAQGSSDGAWLLNGPEGYGVLRWREAPFSADRVAGVASSVNHARAMGWPTPAWRVWGITPEGWQYWVTDYVDARPPAKLDLKTVARILEAVEGQAGLASSAASIDYSALAAERVIERHARLGQPLLGFSPTTEDLVLELRDLGRQLRAIELPGGDVVHGNLDEENVLFAGGELRAFVDTGDVGCGSRVHDFSSLLVVAELWRWDREVADLVAHQAAAVAGPEAVAAFVAVHLVGFLSFGINSWPKGVDRCAAAGLLLLQRLRRMS